MPWRWGEERASNRVISRQYTAKHTNTHQNARVHHTVANIPTMERKGKPTTRRALADEDRGYRLAMASVAVNAVGIIIPRSAVTIPTTATATDMRRNRLATSAGTNGVANSVASSSMSAMAEAMVGDILGRDPNYNCIE